MLVLRDPRHGGARLALASGAERHDLAGRDLLELAFFVNGEVRIEITGFLRRLDDAVHGAADHDELAACGARGIGDGADAGDVGGKGRDGHALRRLGDEAFEHDRDIGLRG
jgi:hypothetical protein